MKLDRLESQLSLNHEKPAPVPWQSALRFQYARFKRDIEAPCMAGIPVASKASGRRRRLRNTGYLLHGTPDGRADGIISILWRRCRPALRIWKRRPKIRRLKNEGVGGNIRPEVILDFSVAREENGISGKLAKLSGNAWIREKAVLSLYRMPKTGKSSLRWSLPPVFSMVRLVSGGILSGKGKLLSV